MAAISMHARRVTKKIFRAQALLMTLVFITLIISSADEFSNTGLRMVHGENRDFYKILGIPRSAKERDVKKAFKKMSIKYHPDKNKGDEGAIKTYQDITAAYDALSDPERRRKYD